MAVEPGVVDANILVYAINGDAPQHLAARSLLEEARDPATKLYVTSQILCEFYSIVTNDRRVKNACSSAMPCALGFRLLSCCLVFAFSVAG